MGRACTVCTHPEADAINVALEAGQTLRALAAQYGLSDSALDQHARRHLWAEEETGAAAEQADNDSGTRDTASARVEAPQKRRAILARVPVPVWAFVGGFLICWLRRNDGPAGTDPGDF